MKNRTTSNLNVSLWLQVASAFLILVFIFTWLGVIVNSVNNASFHYNYNGDRVADSVYADVFSYVALLIFYIIAAIFIGVMGIIATVFLFIACHHEETKNKGFILTSAILSILFVILFPFIVLTFVLGILLFFAYVLMIVFIILALIKNKYDVTILASSENISVGKQSVNNKQQLAKIAKENDVHENLEKWYNLFKKGIITEEEYQSKKESLL